MNLLSNAALVSALGLLLGATLGFLGTYLTEQLKLKHEREHWQLERAAELEDRRSAAERARLQRLSETYRTCISTATVLPTLSSGTQDMVSAMNCFSDLLMLYVGDPRAEVRDYRQAFGHYSFSVPTRDIMVSRANALRRAILALADAEPRLRLHALESDTDEARSRTTAPDTTCP